MTNVGPSWSNAKAIPKCRLHLEKDVLLVGNLVVGIRAGDVLIVLYIKHSIDITCKKARN